MGAYDFNFDALTGESFVPNPERVAAYLKLLPKDNFAFAPPVTARGAWDPWRDSSFGQRVLKEARELIGQPAPVIDNAVYHRAIEEQSVTEINDLIPLQRCRRTTFLLAEAIFDQGEFLKAIETEARSLGQLGTWIHPNNDLERKNLRGETHDNDLSSCHTAMGFALLHHILGPRLSPEFRKYIFGELEHRFFSPLRRRVEAGRDIDWWLIVKHNWNPVCLGCYAQAAAAILPRIEDRAWWLAFSEMHAYNFTDGFADDGLCTEGVAYWAYGVSHYFILAEIIRQGTSNVVDMLDTPKARRIARFPERSEIQPGIWPAFCDCFLDAQPREWARMWLDNRVDSQPDALTEPAPAQSDPLAMVSMQMPCEVLIWMFRSRDPRQPLRRRRKVQRRDFFAPSHFLICRPGFATLRRFSATFLGGHNGVNHNHNDLGTFTVLLDGKTLILDPGLERYSMRTFSKQRYESQLLNSFGHPVPRVGGQLQKEGPTHQAPAIFTEFSDDVDRMVLDLCRAYDYPALRRLEREFLYDRRGDGCLTITDTVEFSEPSSYESALITPGEVEVHGTRLRFRDGDAAISIDYSADGAALSVVSQDRITEKAVLSERTQEPPQPIRIALSPCGKVKAITTRFLIRPD